MRYSVDAAGTTQYEDMFTQPCDCMYCRNFRNAFPMECSDALHILNQMGVQIDHALEIIDFFWNTAKDKRIYEAFFSIKGTLKEDEIVIHDGDARITLYRLDSSKLLYKNTAMEEPCFVARVEADVSWVLNESPED